MKLSSLAPISRVLAKELGITAVLLFGVSIVVFSLLYAAPGDPFASLMGDQNLSEEESAELRESMGVSHTWYGLYASWLWQLLHGDLGASIRSGQPVLALVVEQGINTIILTAAALTIAFSIAISIAVYSVRKNFNVLSQMFGIGAYVISALPVFWLGYMAVYISTHYFGFFPLGSGFTSDEPYGFLKWLLPMLVLGIGSGVIAEAVRYLRLELSRVLEEDYIRTAKAKGASVFKHAYKDGFLLPLIELVAAKMPFVISGAIIVEQIFNWPGLGRLAWQAAQDRDFPLLMGIALAAAIIVRAGNFVHRVVYVIVNPRASHL